MFCKKCGAQQPPGAKFCKKCGAPIPVNQAVPLGTSGPFGGSVPDRTPSGPLFGGRADGHSSARPRRLKPAIIGAVVALALFGGGFYWYRGYSVERKLQAAIDKGNLVTPPGESAWDYYKQYKGGSPNEAKLQKFEERLLPLLKARPEALLTELETPGSNEAGAAAWDEAGRLLAFAGEIRPSDKWAAARADYCVGRVAYLNGRRDEALKWWKSAAEKDTAWAIPANGVGLIYNERKEYATARRFLQEAVRRAPQWALPYNNLGTSYFFENNDAQAEYYYRLAVERAPHWARPHAWLGDIAMRRKAYGEAAQEYQTALNLDPSGAQGLDVARLREKQEKARQLAEQSQANWFGGLLNPTGR
jgi:tetratricopeptide (TPR) repeat protein